MEHAVRGVGLAASVFCGYKLVELLRDFPEPCQLIVAQASAHPVVAEQLGTPLHRTLLWSGRVTEKRAAVQIPVWGLRGRGTLVGRAVCAPIDNLKASGDQDGGGAVQPCKWEVLMLELESPGNVPPPRNLMPEVPQASAEEMEKHAAFHRALARPRS